MDSVKFISVIWLLPIVFMIHDFEEIIFMEWWIKKEMITLEKKYPQILKVYDGLNTASFTFAVAEEFIVLVMITMFAILFNWYYLWFGVLVGFVIHLILHVFQWIIYKKYVPVIITTIPSIMYSIYAIYFIMNSIVLNITLLIIWAVVGSIIVYINLYFAHKLAKKINIFISYK